jgi:hypothetical protein
MKTLILTCSRNDSYCGGYVTGLMQAMTSPSFGGWLKMEHESDIARGRSKLMCQALGTKFDSFLWVDDDIVWTRDDFDAICSLPADCVGGLYVKRHHLQTEVANGATGETLKGHDNVHIVKEVGTGFLRVTRKAVKRLDGIVPEANGWRHYFNAGIQPDGDYLSEDYAFCANLRFAGVPIYLHRGVKLGHVGSNVYRPQ